MNYNPLELILELSEVFQEVLKTASVDGIISSWCFEVTVSKGLETFKQDPSQKSQHIVGLHSLLFFLLEKLNYPNHNFSSNSCNCGWNSSLVPSFLHPAIERYRSGTVIRWAQGECHVLLSLPENDCSVSETNEESNTETVRSDELMTDIERATPAEDKQGAEKEEQNQNSSSDDENSCMLVINEDYSVDKCEYFENKSPMTDDRRQEILTKDDDKSDDDRDSDDSSSVTSSSSSSSYSSTSSDDDDRINFKQRIEEAVQAAREAEAIKVSQIEPDDSATSNLPQSPSVAKPITPSVQTEEVHVSTVQRNPDDIQAAQGLAALGKNPIHPPNRKVSKVSQKLLENQTFQVIRISSKAFECSVCGKLYDRYFKVLEHQSSHTGQKPWECEECGKKFTNHHSLLKHNRAKHMPTHLLAHVCYVCQKSFGNESSLQTHMATHSSTKPFGCNVCGRTFALKVTLDTHEAQHTGNRPWLCNICGRSYVTKYKLRAHMKAHTGELFCSICNRQFFSQDVLTRHRKRHEKGLIHPRPNAQPSTVGNKNKSRTVRAKKQHVSFPQENFKCQMCNKVFNKSTDLSHHLSYCTAVFYCPPSQAVLSTPLTDSTLQLPEDLRQPMEQCLMDKKIFSCSSQEPDSLGNPFILTNQEMPSLTYQQPIHPQDMQPIHCPNPESVNLPDFLKELPFVDGSNSDIFPSSQGQG